MLGFSFELFLDVEYAFNRQAPDAKDRPRLPRAESRPLVLYAVAGIHAETPVSQFTDLSLLRPLVKSRFVPAGVAPQKILVFENLGNISASRFMKAPPPAAARKTLTLKTRVELPVFNRLSRHSSADDLAAVFKAEMNLMLKKKGEEVSKASAAPRARTAASHKTWRELMVEAEVQGRASSFDLAAAFRAEMRALEKQAGTIPAAQPKSAFENKVMSPQPLRPAPALRNPAAA
jgi:hypothetical protein